MSQKQFTKYQQNKRDWRRIYLKNGMITPEEGLRYSVQDVIEAIQFAFYKSKIINKILVFLTKIIK